MIGIVGLGAMGWPIAERLQAAGHPLRVHTRSGRPSVGLDAPTTVWCPTVGDVAAETSIVLIAVATDADLAAVLEAPGDLLAAAERGTVICVLGTHAPATIVRLAEAALQSGVTLLDTPVSGGVEGARAGTLAMMVGGDPAGLEIARPVLDVVAASIVHLGPAGAGSVAKACNQLVVGSTILAVAEALVLAESCGLDPAAVREAMLGGYAASRVLELHGRRMCDEDFAPGARIDLHDKDARIVLKAADDVGLPLDGFEPTATAFREAIEAGDGGLDHSALIRRVRARRIRPDGPVLGD